MCSLYWVGTISGMCTDWEKDSCRSVEKDMRGPAKKKLDPSQQCEFVAWKAQYIPGCIKRRMSRRIREMSVPLYIPT